MGVPLYVPGLRLDWYIALNASMDGGVETFQLPISVITLVNGVCGGVVIIGSGGMRAFIWLRMSVLVFAFELGVGVATGTGTSNRF